MAETKDKLSVASSPYLHSGNSVTKTMAEALIALVPAVLAAAYFFRMYALILISVSVASCLVFELLWQKLLKQPVRVKDLSAVLTGVLLALTLPPALPWWMVVAGAFVSTIFAKQVFGGLGHNPFNPALAGRAFLQISWPQAMNTWLSPVDAVSSATPLTIHKFGFSQALPSYLDLFIGHHAGSLGETSTAALLLGGLFLIHRRQIFAVTPFTFISTVAVGALIFGQNIIFQVCGGGLMLGAFFMATDPVTSPVSNFGRFIFAFGCGALTVLIRLKGGYPEGVCFAILLMNMTVPLIDRFTISKPFGSGGRR